jgi:hypothetical protein
LFKGGDKTSYGAKWDVGWALKRLTGADLRPTPTLGCVNTRPPDQKVFEVESTGGLAYHARANADPIRASAAASLWRSFYRPGCPGAGADDRPTGGYYRGSGKLSAFVRGEGGQNTGEADVATGLELLYSHTHVTGWWMLFPSLTVDAEAAIPVKSAVRDSLGEEKKAHARIEAHGAWHIYLPAQFRFDINGRLWQSVGLEDPLSDAGLNRGTFLALDFAKPLNFHVGRIPIRELFVRRVEGEVPQDWKQRRSWMLGIVAGK